MFEQFGILPVAGGLYDQDMDFLTELRTARTARDDHNLFAAESKDNPELRRLQDRRRTQIVKWRYGV